MLRQPRLPQTAWSLSPDVSVTVRKKLDAHDDPADETALRNLNILLMALCREFSSLFQFHHQPVISCFSCVIQSILQIRAVSFTELQVREYDMETIIVFMRCDYRWIGKCQVPASIFFPLIQLSA